MREGLNFVSVPSLIDQPESEAWDHVPGRLDLGQVDGDSDGVTVFQNAFFAPTENGFLVSRVIDGKAETAWMASLEGMKARVGWEA